MQLNLHNKNKLKLSKNINKLNFLKNMITLAIYVPLWTSPNCPSPIISPKITSVLLSS